LRLWACELALLFFGPSKQYAKPWRHACQKIIILEQNLITLLWTKTRNCCKNLELMSHFGNFSPPQKKLPRTSVLWINNTGWQGAAKCFFLGAETVSMSPYYEGKKKFEFAIFRQWVFSKSPNYMRFLKVFYFFICEL